MIDRQSGVAGFEMWVNEAKWNLRSAVAELDIKIFLSESGSCSNCGIDFEHDVVLVQLGKNGGSLALPKSVVKRVVDGLRRIPKREAVSRSITRSA